MQRLSGQDASFLYQETPATHMHVAGLAIFDTSTASEPYSFERVMEVTRERLHLVPSTRWRLVEVPFELHHPLWVDDPDFDLEYHVRRVAVPPPGGPRELAELAAEISSRPLDRGRPLWETWVVEGLAEPDRIGIISKTHHAAIDGVGGVNMALAMLDLTPVASVEPAAEPWVPERVPTDAGRTPMGPDIAPPPAPFSAPRTSINRSISPHRSFAYGDVSLDAVKAVKAQHGGTVNDVVLALCAGALRSYFERRGETVDGPLVALVPISVRTEDSAIGNAISSMLVSLRTDLADPVERLRAISASTRGAKEQHNAIGADAMQGWQELAQPALTARAARLYSRMRVADRLRPAFNLTISNVPGPPFPLYSFGARSVATYPMGPLTEGCGLNITVASYCGDMAFGFHACREAVDDVWHFPAAVEAELVLASAAV